MLIAPDIYYAEVRSRKYETLEFSEIYELIK